MKVRAVVELAAGDMGLQIRHISRQLGGINVIQSKRLKTRRIDDGRRFFRVHPVPSGARGGVLACIERL